MQSFLEHIIADFLPKNTDLRSLKDVCFVFPTRRAGIYFRKYLADRFKGRYFWSPYILSIVEFTEQLSERVIPDNVMLTFELYKIYKLYEPTVNFDSFYNWGQLLLRDFDEIDKHLIDAKRLFADLKELRSIEEAFALPDDALVYLKEFWHIFQKEENTDLEKEFIRLWQILGQVYSDFRTVLQQNNAAYEGLAQQIIVDQLREKHYEIPFKHVVFAGFNALTVAEQEIMDILADSDRASVYWDSDVYYMHPETIEREGQKALIVPNRQEAGKFLRTYYEKYRSHRAHNWGAQTDMQQSTKHVRIVGVPLKVGQAKYVGSLLQEAVKNEDLKADNTAVVMGDESLLFPMLYALPPAVETVNLTMGYPLKDNPIFQLLDWVMQLHKTKVVRNPPANPKANDNPTKVSKDEPQYLFYNKTVLQILNNPYIKPYNREKIEDYMSYSARENKVYVYAANLRERFAHRIFDVLFASVNDFQDLAALYNDLLTVLFNQIKAQHNITTDENLKIDETPPTSAHPLANDSDESLPISPADITAENDTKPAIPIELEFIYHTLLQLRKLTATLKKYRHAVSPDTYWKLLRDVITSVKLPFTGEPIRGLQIMGFLEARLLDFKNLYIMGMNEGIIPPSRPFVTFIPFNLRRAFNLPTFIDQDSIYAYHFYRLLQRADNVWLLYNTELGNIGGGEKSRFLLQIEYELAATNMAEKIVLSNQIAGSPVRNYPFRQTPLKVAKEGDVAAGLNYYLADPLRPETEPSGRLTPTHLSTYITCPIQFYYKHIARLRELEQIEEAVDSRIFGDVLHKTMEFLYSDYGRRSIQAEDIDQILNNTALIERKINSAFRANKFEVPKEGKNLLLKKVLQRLIIKILETDRADTPFQIQGLEVDKYIADIELPNGLIIGLAGTIDRIDEVTDALSGEKILRILDYKTGKITIINNEKMMGNNFTAYFDKYFTNSDYKAGFQTYMYAYLYWRHSGKKNIRLKAGFYALKEINNGIKYLRKGGIIDENLLLAFEAKLIDLLSSLFDYTYPFEQTQNIEKAYEYSPYKDLIQL